MNKREFAQKHRQEIESVCSEYLKRPSDFGYHGNLDMFNTWALGPVIEHRDSGLLDQSNAATIKKILEDKPELESMWCITSCNHWAVGWIDHLSFKVYSDVLHTKVITPIVAVIRDIYDQLDSYPILDEEDYSNREYNVTLENIHNALHYFTWKRDLNLPEDIESTLFSWFCDNDPSAVENTDDSGGYPSEDQLESALIDLGLYAPESND